MKLFNFSFCSDNAAVGPGSQRAAAAAPAVAAEEEQAGPVPPAQDVRTGLRKGNGNSVDSINLLRKIS